MKSDTIVERLLEQVEGSHFGFVRFVSRISRHEWDWTPDVGMSSARDVVIEHAREEARLVAQAPGVKNAATPDEKSFTTPGTAAAILRSMREATLATLRRGLTAGGGPSVVADIALALAQVDAHAFGEIAVLQRLIDPSRATPSSRT